MSWMCVGKGSQSQGKGATAPSFLSLRVALEKKTRKVGWEWNHRNSSSAQRQSPGRVKIHQPNTLGPQHSPLLQRAARPFLFAHSVFWSSLTTHLLTWTWTSPVLDNASLAIYKSVLLSHMLTLEREQATTSLDGKHQGPIFCFHFWILLNRPKYRRCYWNKFLIKNLMKSTQFLANRKASEGQSFLILKGRVMQPPHMGEPGWSQNDKRRKEPYKVQVEESTCNLLLIQPLSPHEGLHFVVQGEGAIILSKAVEEFDVLEFLMLITNWKTI